MIIKFYHDEEVILEKFNIPVPRKGEGVFINDTEYEVFGVGHNYDADTILINLVCDEDCY